tara:strand:- start:124 stop:369 length:246 start_codon:yes stop_codon:yes gene_type:complete
MKTNVVVGRVRPVKRANPKAFENTEGYLVIKDKVYSYTKQEVKEGVCEADKNFNGEYIYRLSFDDTKINFEDALLSVLVEE